MASIGEGKEREADLKGQRLLSIVNHPEWQEFTQLCEEIYEENLRRILAKDDPEARGAMNALKEIFFRVNRDIKFGAECRQKIFNGLSSLKNQRNEVLSGLPR